MDKFPKVWVITANIRSPENATADDVRMVLRHALPALKVTDVQPLNTSQEPDECQSPKD